MEANLTETTNTPPAEPASPEASASTASERPRLYVACLAAYNAGTLHGRWIEATTPDDIWREVAAMLRASPEDGAEEYAIHDYEGFEGIPISEFASFETVCALADFVTEHGALGAKVYRHVDEDLDAAREAFDNYAGVYPSAAHFAEEITRDGGTKIPKALEYYIDWEAMARDMVLNGDIFVIETGFDEAHIFWSR
jgi:antirestriction protein